MAQWAVDSALLLPLLLLSGVFVFIFLNVTAYYSSPFIQIGSYSPPSPSLPHKVITIISICTFRINILSVSLLSWITFQDAANYQAWSSSITTTVTSSELPLPVLNVLRLIHLLLLLLLHGSLPSHPFHAHHGRVGDWGGLIGRR